MNIDLFGSFKMAREVAKRAMIPRGLRPDHQYRLHVRPGGQQDCPCIPLSRRQGRRGQPDPGAGL